ncbi:MAG: hypothetical protein PVG39_16280, partial [Desulfobacteraceae bacterium]
CIGGAGSRTGYESYDGIGAIGYADTDKVIMDAGTGEYHNNVDGYGDVKLMTYMGQEGKAEEIINGKYEFWSAQWLFTDGDEGALIDDLNAFASDSANLPGSKADYWAAQDDMKVEKDTDFSTQKVK